MKEKTVLLNRKIADQQKKLSDSQKGWGSRDKLMQSLEQNVRKQQDEIDTQCM